jgi:peptide/nickel transport system permease protein
VVELSDAASPTVERAALAEPAARGPTRAALARVARDRAAVAGLLLVLLISLAAAAAPLLAPHPPREVRFDRALASPGREFVLGSDSLGRDELSRLLYGARVSLASVVLATFAIIVIGVAVGLVSGFFGGIVDSVIQRALETVMAFPSLIFALAIAGMLGPSMRSVMIAVIAVSWVSYARLVRGMVLSERGQPYVEAARAIGAGDVRIMRSHVLRNVVPPIVVLATIELGGLLLAISSLSFLGLGAQPPTPEWGTMLNEARPFFQSAPHLMLAPGAAITLTVLSFNLIGDGLRDALDPRTRGAVAAARRRRRRRLGRRR